MEGAHVRCKGKVVPVKNGGLLLDGFGLASLSEIENLEALTSPLKYLSACNNSISTLDGLSRFPELETLELIGNRITSLNGIEAAPKLTRLDLSDNLIEKIEGLASLAKLTTLTIENNRITRIDGLDKNTGLRHLNLARNAIARIENIGHLSNLETLNLETNRIKDIEGLENLNNLTKLEIDGNPIDELLLLHLGGTEINKGATSPKSFVRYCKEKAGVTVSSLDGVKLLYKPKEDEKRKFAAFGKQTPRERRALLKNVAVSPELLQDLEADMFNWHQSQFYCSILADDAEVRTFDAICYLSDMHVEMITDTPDRDGYIYFYVVSNTPSDGMPGLIGRFSMHGGNLLASGPELYPDVQLHEFEATFAAIKSGDDKVNRSLSDFLLPRRRIQTPDLRAAGERSSGDDVDEEDPEKYGDAGPLDDFDEFDDVDDQDEFGP